MRDATKETADMLQELEYREERIKELESAMQEYIKEIDAGDDLSIVYQEAINFKMYFMQLLEKK